MLTAPSREIFPGLTLSHTHTPQDSHSSPALPLTPASSSSPKMHNLLKTSKTTKWLCDSHRRRRARNWLQLNCAGLTNMSSPFGVLDATTPTASRTSGHRHWKGRNLALKWKSQESCGSEKRGKRERWLTPAISNRAISSLARWTSDNSHATDGAPRPRTREKVASLLPQPGLSGSRSSSSGGRCHPPSWHSSLLVLRFSLQMFAACRI